MKNIKYMKAKITAAIVATLVILSSCVKNELHDTDHPETGKITLTTDWTKRTDGIAIPLTYTAVVGTHSATLGGAKNIYPALILPGSYTLYLYNSTDKITINGTVASVATTTGGFVEPLPGWLFSARADVTILADRSHDIIVEMKQEVRQLTLTLVPEGGVTDEIAGIEATLTGIAGAWDFGANLSTGNALSVPFVFVKQTNGTWEASARLIGIIGDEQKLTGTIAFKNGVPSDMALDSDLSADLSTFNTGKHKPILLSGNVETTTEAGFSATIKAWETNPSGFGIAN